MHEKLPYAYPVVPSLMSEFDPTDVPPLKNRCKSHRFRDVLFEEGARVDFLKRFLERLQAESDFPTFRLG